MELVVLIIVAASTGLITRFSVPQREEYGLLLLPSLTLAVALIVWSLGLLIGMNGDHFLLWVLALAIPTVIGIAVAKILPGKRIARHEARVAELVVL